MNHFAVILVQMQEVTVQFKQIIMNSAIVMVTVLLMVDRMTAVQGIVIFAVVSTYSGKYYTYTNL